MGNEIEVNGAHSFGIGLDDPASAHVVTQANTMAIMGGKVGIGTTSPNEKLTVASAISLGEGAAPSPTAGYGKIYVKSSDSKLYFKDDGGSEYNLCALSGIGGGGTANYIPKFTSSTAIGNSVIYETGGKIGIGTTSPLDPLHVKCDSGSDGIHLEEYSGGEDWQLGVDSAGDLNFEDSGTARVTFEDGGNVGIGTNNPSTRLEVSTSINGGLRITDGTTVGIAYASGTLTNSYAVGTVSNHPLIFGTNNVFPHMMIDTSGNVGIGTTGPTAKLEIKADSNPSSDEPDRYSQIMIRGETDPNNIMFIGMDTTDEYGGIAYLKELDHWGPLVLQAKGGNVGIGTTAPGAKLDVKGTNYNVIRSEYTGSGSTHARAVYGKSRPADQYGYGGYFEGGWKGVYGSVSPTGSMYYIGVHGYVSGGSGTNYGVYGYAAGGSTNYGVYYSGGLAGTGSKSCVVKTSQGPTLLYCQESPENWFEDFGEGELVNGKGHIELDSLFLETVTIDNAHSMKVFVQLEGDCNGVYVSKGATGFDVIELNNGDSNARFSYRVVAKRQGFEDNRLDYCSAAENDPILYPDAKDRID
jgi:hypothetical protein